MVFIYTVTVDNDKEFAIHKQMPEALNIKFYLFTLIVLRKKTSNENINNLIRQYFFTKSLVDYVLRVQNLLEIG